MSGPGLIDRLLAAGLRGNFRGAHRARRLLRPDLMTARTRYGDLLRLDPSEYVDGFILRHGFYESEVFEAVRDRLKPGDVFWDVGSNVGQHAVTVASQCPGAGVFAFEPLVRLCQRISAGAALNGVTVGVVPVALSDRQGPATLHVQPGNLGMSSLYERRDRNAGRTVCYETTGDLCVESGVVPAPAAIKIDVEGHEAAVLRGLAATIASGIVRTIVFESGPDAAADAAHPIGGPLRAAGFRLERLGRNEPSAHDLENFLAARS